MIYRQTDTGFEPVTTADVAFVRDGGEFRIAVSALALWSDDEIAAIGLFRADDPAIPPGEVLVSVSRSLVDGRLVVTATTTATRSPEDLRAHAAARRYAVETGGIVVDGATIDTARDSQALITGAHAYAQGADTTIRFKAASGWVSLSSAQMIAVAEAVAAHVQASFAAEEAVDAAIAAGTITTFAEIDAAAWPANG